MHVGNYLGLAQASEQQLAWGLRQVAGQHGYEPDIAQPCQLAAGWSDEHCQALQPLIDRYSAIKSAEPERLNQVLFQKPRPGNLGLMRDLHDLWLLASEIQLCWTVLLMAARGLRDREMEETCQRLNAETHRQLKWLLTRIKQAAPQTLIAAD